MATGTRKHSPLIILLFVFFSIAVLVFLVVFINFIRNPPTNPTSTTISIIPTLTSAPSLTPTYTSTISPTPRPTWTLRPSATVTTTPSPTFTLTPTLIRTITPAIPARYNDRYELKPWDLSEQVRTIELLQANAVLSPSSRTFSALAFAEGEANIRFPESLEAIQWRWDRAYNLILVRDPQGITIYARLIQMAISSGQVRSGDLPAWFSQYETRLKLDITPFPPQPGELGRELIVITGEGSAFLWLIEFPTETSIFPLINDIDFDQPHENAYLYDDLTGDNSPELVIYRRISPKLTQLINPHIFELSTSPPAELSIQDRIPMDFGLELRTEVNVEKSSDGGNLLRVTTILLPACPTYVTQDYTWNGETFTISPLNYELVPVSGLLAYCQIVIDEATSSWGPEPATSVIKPLVEIWPPETDLQGHPYPIDAYDQLRYRLGILYALAGNRSEAISYFNEVINTSSVTNSAWITAAQQFLQAYQQPENLYLACQLAQYCNLRDALHAMVKSSRLDDPTQVLVFLQNNGIATQSGGYFDFDKDGQDERWMIIKPKPEEKLEFWILSKMETGVQAIFVQVFEATESLPYYHEPAGTIPVIQFELHKGFVFTRLPETHEAYIQWVDVEYSRPTIILDTLSLAINTLLDNEGNAASIRDSIIEALNSPRFKGDCIAFRICDQYHYMLGLLYNLTFEDGNAIDQYLWVWRNYGQSPYATLARLKLDYFPLPTYTQSAVPSRTVTPTRTPTSATISPTSTVTPSITVSPTQTLTPTQTSTYTLTPTSTETGTTNP